MIMPDAHEKTPTKVGALSIPMKTISFVCVTRLRQGFGRASISYYHIFMLYKASRVPCQSACGAKIGEQSSKQLPSIDFQCIEIELGA
jgi:hypothetical protein